MTLDSHFLPTVATAVSQQSHGFNHVISYLEHHRHGTESIDILTQEFGLKRRPFYEFLTICCTFGISHRASTNSVQWHGIDQSARVIGTIRRTARESGADDQLKDILTSSVGPSVSEISLAVVRLFFLLRVQSLDIRKVSRVLAQRKAKYRTILRKVYTVACGLELARIVKKTNIASEIQLQVPLDWNSERPQMGLMAILNTKDEMEEEEKWARRRQAFEDACMEQSQASEVPPSPRRIVFPPILPLIAQLN
jgi:hypothetical protein